MADMRYFPGVKRSEREADHSTSCSIKVDNKRSYITNNLMACTRNIFNGILNRKRQTRRQILLRADGGKTQTYITKKEYFSEQINNSPITIALISV